MAIFKCKMCGGTLEIKENMSICECQHCGTLQTIPKLDDEKRARLYDRANHFRRINEYDKAMGVFESILAEDNEDAEAYWSLVLCRYGIDYVEEPKTHKRVPTVNRAQYTSVFVDEDFKSAIKNADGYQRDIYEAEAKAIDEIQKGILEISEKEDPFDVFISYKETDHTGNRTLDSVCAQDIYNALIGEGYKVFFSKITLEDKLGVEYEPYIFAALHSAPVMIVVGTSAENLNSAWVKNEWSRYLALIKSGEEKTLIPVYKDMDPYDLPEDFSYLQAQNVNKVGFLQDLVRGVKKIVSQEVVDERQTKETSSVIVETMRDRGSQAITNSDWETAIRCYNGILDYNENDVDALIGKLKALKKVDELDKSLTPLDSEKEYQLLLEIADEQVKNQLIEQNRISTNNSIAYNRRKKKKTIIISALIVTIVALLVSFGIVCKQIIIPEHQYKNAGQFFEEGKYQEAYELYLKLGDYNDAANMAKESQYQYALSLIDEEKYSEAIDLLETLNDYKDSSDKLKEAKYLLANEYLTDKNYSAAVELFESLGDYKESKEKSKEARYQNALDLYSAKEYDKAKELFDEIISYKEAKAYSKRIDFIEAEKGETVIFGEYDGSPVEWYVLDKTDDKVMLISKWLLENHCYDDITAPTTWKNSSIRHWMNGVMYDDLFNEDEKKFVLKTNVVNNNNSDYGTKGGNDTEDRLFLLSYDEAKEYMAYFNPKSATDDINKPPYNDNNPVAYYWWLRTPGYQQDCAVYLRGDNIDPAGTFVYEENPLYSDKTVYGLGVRPAMWVSIK